jgi:hypothetical protein
MRLRTKITSAVAAFAGVLGGGLVAASPAMASYHDCQDYANTICMMDGSNYTGRVWRQTPDQIIGCRKLAPDNFNNMASLLWNNTRGEVWMYVYDNDNCTGASAYLASGGIWHLEGQPFDGKASSIRVIQG